METTETMKTTELTKTVLLSGKALCKRFGNKEEYNMVLSSLDIDIYEGDFTIIMGSSGAGKSTLLYALSGMDKLSSGTVSYRGETFSDYNERNMSRLLTNEFGFVFQSTHLVSNLTLIENVETAGYLSRNRSAKETKDRAKELLRAMNVSIETENRLPSAVSGGEAQRAAVARAVINNPGIIFADEPTGALNNSNTEEVLNLFGELNKLGQSILMVTHDIRSAIRGNRMIYLEDGKIIDEMRLPAYQKADTKERETKLNEWLLSLRW